MIWWIILCVTPFAVLAGIILAEVALLLGQLTALLAALTDNVKAANRRDQK